MTGYSFKEIEDVNNPGNADPNCIQMTHPNNNDDLPAGDIVSVVPVDPKNKDYKVYQEWIAEGNTIEAWDA